MNVRLRVAVAYVRAVCGALLFSRRDAVRADLEMKAQLAEARTRAAARGDAEGEPEIVMWAGLPHQKLHCPNHDECHACQRLGYHLEPVPRGESHGGAGGGDDDTPQCEASYPGIPGTCIFTAGQHPDYHQAPDGWRWRA